MNQNDLTKIIEIIEKHHQSAESRQEARDARQDMRDWVREKLAGIESRIEHISTHLTKLEDKIANVEKWLPRLVGAGFIIGWIINMLLGKLDFTQILAL